MGCSVMKSAPPLSWVETLTCTRSPPGSLMMSPARPDPTTTVTTDGPDVLAVRARPPNAIVMGYSTNARRPRPTLVMPTSENSRVGEPVRDSNEYESPETLERPKVNTHARPGAAWNNRFPLDV